MGWDVPFIGHPSLASGEIGTLIDKPANWEKVYAIGYKSCSYDAAGKLPPRNEELLAKLQGKVNLQDTLLWWVACGIDAVNLVAKAVETGGSSSSESIIKTWNALKDYPGYFGDYSYTPDRPQRLPRLGYRHVGGLDRQERHLRPRPRLRLSRMLASILASGLAVGAVYALIGITYNTMFSTSRVMSFTAGQLGMLGGVFGSLFMLRLGLPWPVALVLTLPAARCSASSPNSSRCGRC